MLIINLLQNGDFKSGETRLLLKFTGLWMKRQPLIRKMNIKK